METRSYSFAGVDLELQVGKTVFEPNLTTRLLAESVEIPDGGCVLDIGCGVGPIALIAARLGAKDVIGVDIMHEAVELARRNAALNGLAQCVHFLESDLFEGLNGKRFDVIIDDVSGMADRIARISPWYPESIPTGGPDGTGPTIAMLEQSLDHLVPGGLLYFPVLSLANYRKIMRRAQDLFGEDTIERVAQKWVPFCDEFKANLPELEAMQANGEIEFVTKRSRYLWWLEIHKITYRG